MATVGELLIKLALTADTSGATAMTAALSEVVKAAQGANSAMGGAGTQTNNAFANLQKTGQSISKVGAGLTKAVTVPVVAMGTAAVKSAMDFETAFVGVQKTVDETTTTSYDKIKKSIMELSRETKFSQTEIANVAEAAGQLGVSADDLMRFSNVMLQLGTATNLSATDAATQLARFTAITGSGVKDVDRLGSSIVELGNNFPATEAEIVDMAMRLAAAGSQVKMTDSSIMGLAAGLTSVGLAAEAGGTAFSRVMLNIDMAAADGEKSMKDFAQVAGMSAKDFLALWKSDSTEGIMKFVQGLSRISDEGGNLAGTLGDLGFSDVRVRDTLMRSAGSYEQFAKAINMANDAFEKNIALQTEFDKANGTGAATMDKMKNALNEVAITAGEVLAPHLKDAAEGVAGFLKGFAEMDSGSQKTILALTGIAAAIGPITAAVGGFITTIGSLGSALAGVLVAAPELAALAGIGALIAGGWALATQEARNYEAAVKAAHESSGLNMENVKERAANIKAEYEKMSGVVDIIVNIQTQGEEKIDRIQELFQDDGKFSKKDAKTIKQGINVEIDADIAGAREQMEQRIEEISDALSGLTLGDIDLTSLQGEINTALAALTDSLSGFNLPPEVMTGIRALAADLSLVGDELTAALGGLGLDDTQVQAAVASIESFRTSIEGAFAKFGVSDNSVIQKALTDFTSTIETFYADLQKVLTPKEGEQSKIDLSSVFPDIVAMVTDWTAGLPAQINGIEVAPLDLSELVGKLLSGADTSATKEKMGLTTLTDERLKSLLGIDDLSQRVAGLLGTPSPEDQRLISDALAGLITGSLDLQGEALFTNTGLAEFAGQAIAELAGLIADLTSAKDEVNTAIDGLVGKTGAEFDTQLAEIEGKIQRVTELRQELAKQSDPNYYQAELAEKRINAGVGNEEDVQKVEAKLLIDYETSIKLNENSYAEAMAELQQKKEELTKEEDWVGVKNIEIAIGQLKTTFEGNEADIKKQLVQDMVDLMAKAYGEGDLGAALTEKMQQYNQKLDALALMKNLLQFSEDTGLELKKLMTEQITDQLSKALNISPDELLKGVDSFWGEAGAKSFWHKLMTGLVEDMDSLDTSVEAQKLGEAVEELLQNPVFADTLRNMDVTDVQGESPLLQYAWAQLKLGEFNGDVPQDVLDSYATFQRNAIQQILDQLSPQSIQDLIHEGLEKGSSGGGFNGGKVSTENDMYNYIAKALGLGNSFGELPPSIKALIKPQVDAIWSQINDVVNELMHDNPGMTVGEAYQFIIDNWEIIFAEPKPPTIDVSGVKPNVEGEIAVEYTGDVQLKVGDIVVDAEGKEYTVTGVAGTVETGQKITVIPSGVEVSVGDTPPTLNGSIPDIPIGTATVVAEGLLVNFFGTPMLATPGDYEVSDDGATVTLKPGSLLVDPTGVTPGFKVGEEGYTVPIESVTGEVGTINYDLTGATATTTGTPPEVPTAGYKTATVASAGGGMAALKGSDAEAKGKTIPIKVDTIQYDVSQATAELTGNLPTLGAGDGETESMSVPVNVTLEPAIDTAGAETAIAEAAQGLASAAQEVEIDGSSAIASAEAMAGGIASAMEAGAAAVEAAASAMTTAANSVQIDPSAAIASAEEMASGIASAMESGVAAVDAAAAEMGAAASNIHIDASGAIAAAAAVGAGIAAGLRSSLGEVQAAAAELAAAVNTAEKLKSKLKINSPSRVMMEIGRFIGEGLAVGLESGAELAQRQASDMADRIFNTLMGVNLAPDLSGVIGATNALQQSFGGGAAGAADEYARSSWGVQQNVVINSPNALTPSRIAKEMKEIGQQLAGAGGGSIGGRVRNGQFGDRKADGSPKWGFGAWA